MDIEDVSVSIAAAHDSITEMASDLKDIREDVRQVKSAVAHHEGRILKLETKPA